MYEHLCARGGLYVRREKHCYRPLCKFTACRLRSKSFVDVSVIYRLIRTSVSLYKVTSYIHKLIRFIICRKKFIEYEKKNRKATCVSLNDLATCGSE